MQLPVGLASTDVASCQVQLPGEVVRVPWGERERDYACFKLMDFLYGS